MRGVFSDLRSGEHGVEADEFREGGPVSPGGVVLGSRAVSSAEVVQIRRVL